MSSKKERGPIRVLVLISQLGITMLVAIAIAGFLGLKLTAFFQKELIFPFCLLLGAMAGFRSCYKIILKFVSMKNSDSPRKSAFCDQFPEKDDE